jgi:hypothetical protein
MSAISLVLLGRLLLAKVGIFNSLNYKGDKFIAIPLDSRTIFTSQTM